MDMMDGMCCAYHNKYKEEQYNEATREQLEQFFALYEMKPSKSEISTATTTLTSNSASTANSRYTVFKEKR